MANSEKEKKQPLDRSAREQLKKNTELFYVIRQRYDGEESIIDNKRLEDVQKCLRNGADINAVDKNNLNNTVLHVAIENNYSKIVEYLLSSGARTDMENGRGENALALAQALKCNREILDILEIVSKSSNTEDLGGIEHSSSTVKIDYLSQASDLWSNLESNSDMMILKIECCKANPTFLKQKVFYEAINSAANLFFVDVMVSNCKMIDLNYIKSQVKDMDKQLIIQCSSVLDDKTCCIVRDSNVEIIDLNSDVERYDEKTLTDKLSRKDGFGIGLIIEALKLNLVGTFESERSLLKVKLYLEKHYGDWKLIDHAVRYGDVLTVRLLALNPWNLSKLNPKRTCTLGVAAEYGNIEKLAAVLRLNFPIHPTNKICFPEETGAHFDKFKKQMLQTAVRAGNCDVVSFMRRCGVELDKEIVEYAWDNKRYEIVLILLKADCAFPRGFHLDKNDASLRELRTFVNERDDLHGLIKGGNLDDLITFVKSKARSKLYLNKSNESALRTALKHGKFEIFEWLQSVLKAEFKDEYERSLDNAHILKLVARSRSLQPYPGFEERIEGIYKELDNIPEISTVLKVIQFCDRIDIIYDFENGDVNIESSEKVLCEHNAHTIYIKAKVDPENERELLGTIACELTRIAIQTVYGNNGKPFNHGNNPMKDCFIKIVKEITEKAGSVDVIIRRVFTCYGEDKWPSELIVRVNHMLATYSSEKGMLLLEEHTKSLMKYYQDYVVPCCNTFIKESHHQRYIVNELNEYAGITNRIDESKIKLKNSLNVRKLFSTSEVQIAVVTSTSPFLSTMSVYQSLNEISQQPNSFIIFNFDGYIKRRINIQEAFSIDACKFLVLSCHSDPEKSVLYQSLEDLAKLVLDNPDKKIIFIMRSCEILKETPKIKKYLSVVVYPDVEYTLDDVRVESAKLLLDQSVSLQCRDANIKLSSLIDEEHFELVDAQTLLKLINKQPIVIGKEIVTSGNYDQHFYIKRTFSHQALINDDVIRDDNKSTKYAISEIDKTMLANIVKSTDSIETYECLGKGHFVKYIILDSQKGTEQYQLLCQRFPRYNIHRLKKVEGGLYWLESRCVEGGLGLSRLQKFVIDQSLYRYTEDELVDQVDKLHEVVVLDTDEIGVLTSVAQRMKRRCPLLWVIKINLKDYTEILEWEISNEKQRLMWAVRVDQQSRALTFLVDRLLGSRAESRLETEFEKNLLLHFLEHNEDRVVIMFDGFDEIKESHQNVIKDVLVALKSSKVKQLWVTTRPHMREILENTLHHLSYTLQPFDETDQVNILTRFWRHTVVEPHVASDFTLDGALEKLQCFAEAVIELLSKSNSDKDRIINGIPLILRMAAEIFEQDLKEFCFSNQTQPNLPSKLYLNDLYQMFYNIKFIVFESQKKILDSGMENLETSTDVVKDVFLNNHRIASLFTNFTDKESELLLSEEELNSGVSFLSDIARCKWNTGIIDSIVEGKPHFVHSSFEAHSTAEFIVNLLVKEQQNINRMDLIITRVFYDYDFRVVRAFIDSLLGEKGLSEAVLNMNGSVIKDVLETYRGYQMYEGYRPSLGRWDNSLHVAAQEGKANIASLLLNSLGNSDVSARLIRYVGDLGKRALHLAAEEGHLEVVKILLNYGADVNAVTRKDFDFLCRRHVGRRYDQTPLHLAALYNKLPIVEMLLNSGASVNAVDSVGQTPLHVAAEWGSELMVESILQMKDVDVNVVDKSKRTPLHLAAVRNNLQIVKVLISSGAKVNAANSDGQTPLHIATRRSYKQMVEFLLETKDIVNAVDKIHLHRGAFERKNQLVEMRASSGANVHAVDSDGHNTFTPSGTKK